MTEDARARLRMATLERERLRRKWDSLRNRDLFALAVLSLPRLLRAERCGIFVASPDGTELWLEAGTGVTERQIIVHSDGSMVGEVLRSGTPLQRRGLLDVAGAHAAVGEETRFAVRDALTYPIRNVAGTAVVGAVQLLNHMEEGPWTEEDLTLLGEIAYLLQETVQRLHEGQEILDEAGALDRRIHELDRAETAIRGGRMLRTFEPAEPLPSGGFLHHRWNGTVYPPFIDPTATKALTESWDTDEHDLFLCTHQKVGTHLAKKYLVELARHLLDYPEGHPMRTGDIGHDTVPWPEVMYSQHGRGRWAEFLAETAGHTRIWYVHCSYEDLPVRRIHPRSRFVVVTRDPRATAVSQYFFWKRHPLLQVPEDLDLDLFSSMFAEGDLYFGDYHRHVLSWLRRKDARIPRENLLVLRYEDLVERKLEAVDRLAAFVAPGRTLSPELRMEIALSTEFDTMKKSISENPGSFHLNPKVYFRSGKTNDWEEHLSPLAIEAIDQKTREVWGGESLITPPLDGLLTLD